jgi:hypothetical protein
LGGSKASIVIPVKTGIQKNYSHPEFISVSLAIDAKTSSA